MENYTGLHLVGCLDRKKPQVPSEQEQQYPEDEDEVFSFVHFWCKQEYREDLESVRDVLGLL